MEKGCEQSFSKKRLFKHVKKVNTPQTYQNIIFIYQS